MPTTPLHPDDRALLLRIERHLKSIAATLESFRIFGVEAHRGAVTTQLRLDGEAARLLDADHAEIERLRAVLAPREPPDDTA